MAAILQNNIVFYHIPKTAGTFCRRLFDEIGLFVEERGLKHDTPISQFSYSNKKSSQLLSEVIMRRTTNLLLERALEKSFCVVRHPVEWYASWYKYMNQPSRNWRDWGEKGSYLKFHPVSQLNGFGGKSFNHFVESCLKEYPGFVSNMFATYTDYVAVTCKQETLRKDLLMLFDEFNFPVSVAHKQIINIKEKQHVSPFVATNLDLELEKELYKVEYSGLKRYKYL